MAGRPRLYGPNVETGELSLTLSRSIIAELDAVAARLGMTSTQYLRSLVHQHVAKITKPT